jgi:hypothetical protein
LNIEHVAITPENAQDGGQHSHSFALVNQANISAALMVDFSIHFIKANGKPNPNLKVFKLKAFELAPNQSQKLSKKVSLKPMSTRTLYLGSHKVEEIVNGKGMLIGDFDLSE